MEPTQNRGRLTLALASDGLVSLEGIQTGQEKLMSLFRGPSGLPAPPNVAQVWARGAELHRRLWAAHASPRTECHLALAGACTAQA